MFRIGTIESCCSRLVATGPIPDLELSLGWLWTRV
jgi:hypothetical protein